MQIFIINYQEIREKTPVSIKVKTPDLLSKNSYAEKTQF